MSTHCYKYPNCGCPSDIGHCGVRTKEGFPETDKSWSDEKAKALDPRYVEKTDGNGNSYKVPNPNYQDENGNFRKYRHKPTNFKAKKKKRKK